MTARQRRVRLRNVLLQLQIDEVRRLLPDPAGLARTRNALLQGSWKEPLRENRGNVAEPDRRGQLRVNLRQQ